MYLRTTYSQNLNFYIVGICVMFQIIMVQCTCGVNERACDDAQCIPSAQWCDNTQDCSDFSDEASCSGAGDCPEGQKRCTPGENCVPSSFNCIGSNNSTTIPPDSSGSDNTGIYVGVAVGGILILFLIICLVFLAKRKFKDKQNKTAPEDAVCEDNKNIPPKSEQMPSNEKQTGNDVV